ncbi:efflux RND transporter permease subunit [Sedimentitalea sp. JM2-8]|uniref:Efflux RND transporter permease subunit n=1 Tax=Sedimentitalea xiamensis TaxID=3050037 RepID=A0ABT7FG69_9RHOB|nr:efflux RND transporter permease subunit [Sedimentitalea xiamensis]MDK3074121.1 efflux RND transporter permease subunit [Sedimentitalea xiamensis]
MTGIVTWASERARMVLAFIALSLIIGGFAYVSLPKEGEPDIEIPALFVSVQFPGISAEDSESLLIKPMETELADLDGLKTMSSTAAENYAGVALEFDFGWDKTAIMADVRDAMNKAQADFPEGAEQYSINEINFSEFPIVIVNLTGDVPERTMARIAKNLQDDLESLDAVLEAGIAGNREEMLEVVIDPLRLEAYNITALELINVVRNNNQLIAAGEVETEQGTFSVKIPSSFDEPRDVYNLPVKTNGDRVVTLGELAEINFTFEDRKGTARFNGENTVALQVVKRKGYNLIDTVALVKETLAANKAKWPEELQAAVTVGTSNDQSRVVGSMVSQLEGSVLTAVALVMIVVLSALGSRAALLVGFAIPTSFLLCFMFLAIMGVTISNIVMFGLILAVGMLVDGAIVVVEYADKRISEGVGPMHAYVEAAQRMFWPIVSSTATTLCAFLPMLFWPGVPGEFMGMLPVTLIFVLSASLVVALVYLPVMGGVTGRMSRIFGRLSDGLRARLPWAARALLVPVALYGMFLGAMQVLNPAYLLPGGVPATAGSLFGAALFLFAAFASSVTLGAASIRRPPRAVRSGHRHTPFGHFIKFIAGNPVMPVVAIATIFAGVFYVAAVLFPANSRGVEFFVESEPEQATVYVRARGNISLAESDAMVRQAEEIVRAHPAVINVFSFAGDGGLNTDASGAQVPPDTVGQVQFEIIPWENRPTVTRTWFGGRLEHQESAPAYDGDFVIDQLTAELEKLPGFEAEILPLGRGPASGKPVHLRLKGDDWDALNAATALARSHFEALPGLIKIEDSLPLPGIDWQIDVDVEKAGRYGADVATVGGMVQLVTRGILLDTMRVDSSDEEIEIRVRLPQEDRVLSTLDSMKVRTSDGLIPLSNFVTRQPVKKLAKISRVDQRRFYDVKADVGAALFRVVRPDAETGTDRTLGMVRRLAEDAQSGAATARNAKGELFEMTHLEDGVSLEDLRGAVQSGDARLTPVNANERIAAITEWLNTEPLPAGIAWEWTGDQEDQAESGAFLQKAFLGALGLMFIILLAQFNSFYNAVLVLLAVVLSTTGVLIGMLVMNQPFSIIMTGTGIVALAGIVVNNNIVLIDTYQEYSRYMPRIEAIVRTAEARIRPVLLTTITTMAGLAPMMFGLSLDFIGGGYSIDSPTSLWWKQLATAVVFGLGIATVLTLIVTPSFLALRVWFATYAAWVGHLIVRVTGGSQSRTARDMRLEKAARRVMIDEIVWDDAPPGDAPAAGTAPEDPEPRPAEGKPDRTPLKAAE